LLSDEIMISKPGRPPAIGQLVKAFEKTGSSVVSLIEVAKEDVSRYGIVDATMKSPNLWQINSAVEKPEIERAPSRLALTGRYVFDPEIFECLKEIKPDRNGEYQLTDGITLLAKRKGVMATTIEAERFDAREKLGFLQAKVEMALRHPEVGPAFLKYLQERAKEL
jgi:UTP--glucose-1-phosphate uridylyltransferase